MENNQEQNEWKTIPLKDLFSETDFKKVLYLLNTNKLVELKEFLISKRQELESKIVMPEYLYYYLQYLKQSGVIN
jgi:hypothetical protein